MSKTPPKAVKRTRSTSAVNLSRVSGRPAPPSGRPAAPPPPLPGGDEGRSSGLHPRSRAAPRASRPPPGRALSQPAAESVLFAVLAIDRQISLEMHADELVRAYVEALVGLLPGRQFVVRLLDLESVGLAFVHATGRLTEAGRTQVRLTRTACVRHAISTAGVPPGVEIVDEYVPAFDAYGRGFDVPLFDGERLAGVLQVEYAPEDEPPDADVSLVVPFALQLASALRSARLVRESLYLRDYLGKLLENANAPILVIGKHREIRVANRALSTITGLRRDEVLGTDFLKMIPEDQRRRLLPVFVAALRGEPTSNFEVELPRAGGGTARIVVNIASILGQDGDVEGVIAIGRDMTELRELQDQIIQAEKLATLGQLAAGVVHEINNPLTSIHVYADYLLKKSERAVGEGGDTERLRRIVQGAERILNFTRDLVVYARPSPESPKPLDIHEVLDQSFVFCEHVVAESGAHVEKHYARGLAPVVGVRGQLHQVFINLITNACHAMPLGAGKLVVETRAGDDGRIHVFVRDNGSGIRPGDLPRIFEPFFSTKGEGKGTGLGLSIARNIVRHHRGELRVESLIGVGTSFEVELYTKPDAAE